MRLLKGFVGFIKMLGRIILFTPRYLVSRSEEGGEAVVQEVTIPEEEDRMQQVRWRMIELLGRRK